MPIVDAARALILRPHCGFFPLSASVAVDGTVFVSVLGQGKNIYSFGPDGASLPPLYCDEVGPRHGLFARTSACMPQTNTLLLGVGPRVVAVDMNSRTTQWATIDANLCGMAVLGKHGVCL